MKSKLQKKKENENSKYWKNKALALWGEYQHKQNYCSICGKSNIKLEAHHLISRSVPAFLADSDNGIILCTYCHKYNPECSPHAGALGFAEWLELKAPDKFNWYQENKNKIKLKHERKSYKEQYEILKKLLEGK